MKFKPCPCKHCNETKIAFDWNDEYKTITCLCSNCGAIGPTTVISFDDLYSKYGYNTGISPAEINEVQQIAIKAWNRRPGSWGQMMPTKEGFYVFKTNGDDDTGQPDNFPSWFSACNQNQVLNSYTGKWIKTNRLLVHSHPIDMRGGRWTT